MFGVLAGVLTWVAGPSKGIFAVGKAGYLPPFFQKTNKIGVQKNILTFRGASLLYWPYYLLSCLLSNLSIRCFHS